MLLVSIDENGQDGYRSVRSTSESMFFLYSTLSLKYFWIVRGKFFNDSLLSKIILKHAGLGSSCAEGLESV